MTTQETFSKLEEEQMSPQYELDAQGCIVNYCLSLVASDRAAADWQEGTGNAADKDSERSSMELPPLNPLPTSMSSSTSALASIHQEISNYLSATPKSTVKYGDVQVHLGWKITKAADLGASMGEIKKFVKWKVDAHNKRVAKDSAPFNGGDLSQSEGEFSDQGRRFEGASISRRKKNVSENISIGFGESLALGKENKKWACLILGLSIATYFFSGTITDLVTVGSVSDAIGCVRDFEFLSIFEDVGADTFLQPLRQIFGSIIGFFGALVHFVIAGPKAFTSMLAQSISLISRIDIPTLQQFGTALFFPMTSIGPVAHPVYYVLLSIYAFLFTRYLRKEDLMIYEHIGDSPLFSQIFTPAFVAFICYHFITSSLGPVLGMDAMLLQSNEFLRAYGEDGFRAKLGLMGGQSPCGIAELCPQYYFGTGESLGTRFPMAEGMGTTVALVTRAVLAGFLVLGGLDRWRARREIRGARV